MRVGESVDRDFTKSLVDFINSHGSDITVSDEKIWRKSPSGVLNELFDEYIKSYRTVNREESSKRSSIKTLGAFNILLPDLTDFLKNYKPSEEK